MKTSEHWRRFSGSQITTVAFRNRNERFPWGEGSCWNRSGNRCDRSWRRPIWKWQREQRGERRFDPFIHLTE